MACFACPAYS
jgi:hypothetical protein